jgi:hypothetical protein
MMAVQPKAKGAREPGWRRGFAKDPREAPITLAEAGIDKNLAHRARKARALEPEALEAHVAHAGFGAGEAFGRRVRRLRDECPAHRLLEDDRLSLQPARG